MVVCEEFIYITPTLEEDVLLFGQLTTGMKHFSKSFEI
jgi:hypothetical protein